MLSASSPFALSPSKGAPVLVLALLLLAACSPPTFSAYTSYPTPGKNVELAALHVTHLKTLAVGQSRDEVLQRMKADPVEGCVQWGWTDKDRILRGLGFLPCEKREVIQSPYRTQTLEQGGAKYDVLYYYTGGSDPDGGITDAQLTPVILENERLAGWGWEHPLAEQLLLQPPAAPPATPGPASSLLPRAPGDRAGDLNNRAVSFRSQGRYAEADSLFRQALAMMERARGSQHHDVAIILNNLGELYYIQGRYAEAEPLYQRALAIKEAVLGPDDPALVTTLENYAALLAKTNREDQAATLVTRAKLIRTKHDAR